MAEILSREKELFKINQELNLMTLGPSNHEPEHGVGMAMAMGQSRYGTYLKQKGPSTLLKKKLNVEVATNIRPASGRAHKTTRANSNKGAGTSPATTPQSPNLTTQLTRSRGGTISDWRPSKAQCKYSTIHPTSRVDSSLTRKATHKTATYVKYRNPNFTQSPSMDLLLRPDEETETMTQQQQQLVEVEQVVTQQREIRETRESTTVVSGQSKKHLTQDNFIRFLKAKVVILEEDHGALTQEMSVQRERLDEALLSLRNAESQRDQAINSNTKLSDQMQRLEQQLEHASRRQKERQVEYSSQQRELELLRRDNKLLKQANTNLENRLARASDEAEAARQMISQQSGDKREEQELQRKELKVRDTRIKALKRQRADLLNAYKKQLFMIDNLKRQNSCVEQAVAIGFGEKEFNKVLEWNTCSKSAF